MKQSNLDRLIEQYISQKASESETSKIEGMLDAIKERNIHFISDETEELLIQKIKDSKIQSENLALFVKDIMQTSGF